ncbi:MAG: glycosyltransferase [Candidatus Vogelbacteria bacterium]|nr:glycosyltransferase [Candidatus Vogelbacteria bacterium]
MTKKVLYLITKSNWGGAQKYVFDLATNLPKDQFETAVTSGGTGAKGAEVGQLANKLAEVSLPFYPIKSFTRDIFLFNELKAFWEVGLIIKKYRPDILHVNSSKAAGVGGFVGRLIGVKKIIYTVHGWPFNEQRNFISKFLIYFFSWLTCFLVHEVIVINEKDFAQGKKMFLVGKKMHLIYNGLAPISFLSQSEARKKLREITIHNFSDSDLIVGSIAELHPNKGLNYLIEGVAQAPEWKLIIIGGGQEKTNLEKLIQKLNATDRVFLAGFVTNTSTLLKAFDASALVSLKEGHPYAVLESGLASLPVIGSDIPGIRAIIDSPDKGMLVPPANPQAITEALNKLANDPTIRQTQGENLQNKVQSDFNIEKMINSTTQLY